jgi:hypothetical protein
MTLREAAAAAFNRIPATTRRSLLHRFGRFAPWEEGFDFTPPAHGPTEQPGPPDFVGIGAQKAGTTWWYGLITAHPGVWSSPDLHKERQFLSGFGTLGFGPEDIATYHGWFPRPGGTLCGEWTPDYLYYPWVPQLLSEAAPDVKLLVILRDPVERLCSGLAHLWRNGSPRTGATTAEAAVRGFYHQALCQWWEHFDDARLLVLQYERCADDPAGQLAATYRFLGLDETYRPSSLDRRSSVTGSDKVVIAEDTRRRLVEMYRPDVIELAKRVPEIDLSLWPNFAQMDSR